tara:strand:- start:350 stop:511 length:162 start_codon:yes stop_codon:yes gene_type:complete
MLWLGLLATIREKDITKPYSWFKIVGVNGIVAPRFMGNQTVAFGSEKKMPEAC